MELRKDVFRNEWFSLFKFSTTKKNFIRIETRFQYPDCSYFNLYIDNDVLTDFGETLGWVGAQTCGGIRSQKQNEIIDDVLQTYRITLLRGELCIIPANEKLAENIIRLAQAILSITWCCRGQ